MMIEDDELRALFDAESREHLQRLEAGLLRLETRPEDEGILRELFREAHSLKGSARMLGVRTVEVVAHAIEDQLAAATQHAQPFTPDTIDRLTAALDDVRHLVSAAVTGEPAPVTPEQAIERILHATDTTDDPEPEPAPKPDPRDSDTDGDMPVTLVNEESLPHIRTAEPAQTPATPDTVRSDTVRVDTRKLDLLLSQSHELAALRTRLRRLLDEMNALLTHEELARHKALLEQVRTIRHRVFEDEASLGKVSTELEETVGALRMLPLAQTFNLFPRMVRDLARAESKTVELSCTGEETMVDKQLVEALGDPLMHLLRNAVNHGIELPAERIRRGKPAAGTIRIRAGRTSTHIVIDVTDDGQGMDLEAIRREAQRRGLISAAAAASATPEQVRQWLFLPGFSTRSVVTDISGRGVGLNAVLTDVTKMNGEVSVQSTWGVGSCFTLRLPANVTKTEALLVEAAGVHYALPLDAILYVRRIVASDLFQFEGRTVQLVEGQPVTVLPLTTLLDLPTAGRTATPAPGIGIVLAGRTGQDHAERLCLLVDDVVDQLNLVIKQDDPLLRRIRNVAGAAILGNGAVCPVLYPPDLFRSASRHMAGPGRAGTSGPTPPPPLTPAVPERPAGSGPRILLVEDSITTRTQERRILEGAGYVVVTAVDGLDALSKLDQHPFDAVVSDVQMPNLDGLQLTRRIRQHASWRNLPVLLVTSLAAEADIRQGMEAGANAYIAKPSFEQKQFLELLGRLLA
jgi:two-component system chemotaxis sensor kinase CheA